MTHSLFTITEPDQNGKVKAKLMIHPYTEYPFKTHAEAVSFIDGYWIGYSAKTDDKRK